MGEDLSPCFCATSLFILVFNQVIDHGPHPVCPYLGRLRRCPRHLLVHSFDLRLCLPSSQGTFNPSGHSLHIHPTVTAGDSATLARRCRSCILHHVLKAWTQKRLGHPEQGRRYCQDSGDCLLHSVLPGCPAMSPCSSLHLLLARGI